MAKRRIVITAGFDKSEFAICVAELLRRKDVEIVGIIVVNPFSIRRLSKYINQHGLTFVKSAAYRLLGVQKTDVGRNLFADFFAKNNIKFSSLKKWASKNGADYLLVDSINSKRAESFLDLVRPDWLIYCGGGIIRKNIIKVTDGKILNAHLGPLPEVRGMNAIEWAVLLDERKEITIHVINQGIDTGQIIERFPIKIGSNETIDSIRDKAKIVGIEAIVAIAAKHDISGRQLSENNDTHRQCFLLSKSMKELLQYKLNLIS